MYILTEYIYKEVKGKNVKIPKEQIDISMQNLNLTEDEAIQMYLEDEGIETNEEQERLEKLGKENRVTASLGAKAMQQKPRKPREKKRDFEKEDIISFLEKYLSEKYDNVKIINNSKLIEFDYCGNHYRLDLIKQRGAKK